MPHFRIAFALKLTTLLSCLLLIGCCNEPKRVPPVVVPPPVVPKLSSLARQPSQPPICSSTCSAGLAKLQDSLLPSLTSPASPASPASVPTNR